MRFQARFLAACAALVLSCSAVSHMQTPAPSTGASTFAAALRKLAAGDAGGAAPMLEAVTAADPANGRAWRNLGVARQQLKQYDKAHDAFAHALAVEPDVPLPFYQLGVVDALAGHLDAAFGWLDNARATRRIDMTPLANNPGLDALRSDKRYPALLPAAAEFERPFVEDVTVLHEWRGEHSGDQFGWIARAIGDVDADGVTDFVTSAPSHGTGGAQAGRVYVYSTKRGARLWTVDGQAQDTLGSGIEAAGDTNGDGIPDVIASAPGGDYALILSGRDGRVLQRLTAGAKGDQFGTHVAGVGDINGDGFADVIVGAPNNNAGGAQAGRAYVFSGKDGRVLLTLTGEHAGDNFGSAVSGFSDARHRLLVVGAGQGGPSQTGRVYVYRGLSTRHAFTIDGDANSEALGAMFVSVLGDVNGDGVPDVYASDWQYGADGLRKGRVYVQSGADGRRLLTLTGDTPGECLGTSVSRAGDVDGDGHADLIVGAWQYPAAAFGGGRVMLYSGRDGHIMRTFTSRIPGETLGFDAVTIGDVNRDGQDDFLLTSGWSAVNGFHAGRVFIVSSGITKPRRPAGAR